MNSHAVLVGLASSHVNGISTYPATIGVLSLGCLHIQLLSLKGHVCTPKLSDDCDSLACAGALLSREIRRVYVGLQRNMKRRSAPSTPTPKDFWFIFALSAKCRGFFVLQMLRQILTPDMAVVLRVAPQATDRIVSRVHAAPSHFALA